MPITHEDLVEMTKDLPFPDGLTDEQVIEKLKGLEVEQQQQRKKNQGEAEEGEDCARTGGSSRS